MSKNPFLKYLVKSDREGFFHTSRQATVQSGANMGVASAETFAQRRKIDQNRTRVKKYSDSRIAAHAMAGRERAKVYTPPERTIKKPGGIGVGSSDTTANRPSLGGRTTGTGGESRPPMPPRR